MATVLLVSEDEYLQQTRAALLHTIGVNTICCNGSTAMAIQQQQPCELVVLCYSLRIERRSALAEDIRARWPETHILWVSLFKELEHSDSDSGMDTICSMDPEAFIRRAEQLLGEKLLGQRKTCVSERGKSTQPLHGQVSA